MKHEDHPTAGLTRRHLLAAGGAAGLAGVAGPLAAQGAFPDGKPITVLVPFAPGGIADLTARTVTQAMGQILKTSIVVDNRPSAGSIVASQAAAKAAPDGLTLLVVSNGNAVSQGLFKKLPYDIHKDFAFISTMAFFELGVLVPENSRFKTLRDVVAFAKANPGKLTVGTIAVGSTQHLSAELFKTRAGIDAVTVPYKGTPAVVNALRTGEIDVGFEILGPIMGQLDAKVIRAVATTGAQRYARLPDVPTVQEQGVSDYVVASWNALAAPAGTPKPIIDRLQAATNEAVSSAGVQQRFKELGVLPRAGSPAELQTLLNNEISRWGAVIKAAKIEPE
ncbi:Bug family tripartite tricarboxylate transporter substrate binding protein [Aquabacterium sp. J223]|uniref:Bug family tripartite tricarboxylate transporter substrate binding protein n=1 Tax=Aquabacterium sp. J223 TaxID=2898431 RepID=UPI0021ADA573|nr:tripartite tricarboxylate transporter substrate-binding protein [Aquabacterium sp. J223]UUX97473.1 tripartite tricarboxylate transporter substrate binding protein [Aquabacterium sp. J223]